MKRLILTLAAFSAGGSAAAQEWRYDATLYAWVPAMDVNVDTRFFGEVDSQGSGSDAIAALDMAFMGAVAVDIGGGFRLFGMDIDTALNSASNAVQDRGTSESKSWVDPLVAARVIAPLGEKWFATAYADVGGFITQSSSTWQGVATVGYRFDERWSAQFG